MDFEGFKQLVLKNAKEAEACTKQYRRAYLANTIEELVEVIADNVSFVRNNDIVTDEMINEYGVGHLFYTGTNNGETWFNSGYRNSGNQNSGNLNSGNQNSGNLNSGNQNSGYRNSGDRNRGYRNSGDLNSGDLNSGDQNSGNRNSGVFCNRKINDTIMIFNRKSNMTWVEWDNHPVNALTRNLEITRWVSWDNMTDEEKAMNPKAYVCEGYLKVFTYHEAWRNLWNELTPSQRKLFGELPNFDAEVFKDITGIDYCE